MRRPSLPTLRPFLYTAKVGVWVIPAVASCMQSTCRPGSKAAGTKRQPVSLGLASEQHGPRQRAAFVDRLPCESG